MACRTEKICYKYVFLFIVILSISYWIYVAFSFTRSIFITRLDLDLWENPLVIQATDLLLTDPIVKWSYYINSLGNEILLLLTVLAIGYILWREKRDYFTVLALFASITLVIYLPNLLHIVWQLERLLAIDRFQLFLGPFMALMMGAGIYILSQYLLKTKIPVNVICIMLIAMIFIYGSSTTGLLKIDPSIYRDNFNSDEVKGLDFVYQHIPYGSIIHTDYYSQRYLDTPHFSNSETLGLPFFSTGIVVI